MTKQELTKRQLTTINKLGTGKIDLLLRFTKAEGLEMMALAGCLHSIVKKQLWDLHEDKCIEEINKQLKKFNAMYKTEITIKDFEFEIIELHSTMGFKAMWYRLGH